MFKQIIQTISPIQFTYLVHRSNFACKPSSSENSYRIEPLKERGLYGMHNKMDRKRCRDVVRRRMGDQRFNAGQTFRGEHRDVSVAAVLAQQRLRGPAAIEKQLRLFAH